MDGVANRVFLDVRQAAELIGLSKSYLDKMRMTGKGPDYLRVGARVVYRRRDIEAWFDKHVQSSTAENRAMS